MAPISWQGLRYSLRFSSTRPPFSFNEAGDWWIFYKSDPPNNQSPYPSPFATPTCFVFVIFTVDESNVEGVQKIQRMDVASFLCTVYRVDQSWTLPLLGFVTDLCLVCRQILIQGLYGNYEQIFQEVILKQKIKRKLHIPKHREIK